MKMAILKETNEVLTGKQGVMGVEKTFGQKLSIQGYYAKDLRLVEVDTSRMGFADEYVVVSKGYLNSLEADR
ncbi:hypothetical protein ACQVTX_23490 [Bacillus pretiosus]|uniref:hypothetical protein n=1 Tax=Bacillus pretiosus TaxID=2983392 RepID=UPI003D65BD7C